MKCIDKFDKMPVSLKLLFSSIVFALTASISLLVLLATR